MLEKFDDIKAELTKLMIKQDFKDKAKGKVEIRSISQVDLYKLEIKLMKIIEKYLFTE